VGLGCCASTFAQEASSTWTGYQKLVKPFFAKHCLECHADKESGEVRLDRFKDEAALAKGVATIDKVLGMLKKGAMPPQKTAATQR